VISSDGYRCLNASHFHRRANASRLRTTVVELVHRVFKSRGRDSDAKWTRSDAGEHPMTLTVGRRRETLTRLPGQRHGCARNHRTLRIDDDPANLSSLKQAEVIALPDSVIRL